MNSAYQEIFERDEDESESEERGLGDESDLNTKTVGAYPFNN